jgi:putative transposase
MPCPLSHVVHFEVEFTGYCAKMWTDAHVCSRSPISSYEFTKLLELFKIRTSMSRRGNCYDNAPMESFWGTLKNELVYHQWYATRQQAIQKITEYIEIYYN